MTKKKLIQNLWRIFIVNNKYECFLDSEKKIKDSLTHQARLEEEGRAVRGVEGQKLMEVWMDHGKLEHEYEAAKWMEVEKPETNHKDQEIRLSQG